MFTGILIIGFLLFALCFAICYNRFVDIYNRKQLQKELESATLSYIKEKYK